MVWGIDGQETQVLDDDPTQPDPEPPFDTHANSPKNNNKLCEEINSPMNKFKPSEELNAPNNKEKPHEEQTEDNNIIFGETQALGDDLYEWETNKTQLYGETPLLEDSIEIETQLYDQTQVFEDRVDIESRLFDQNRVFEDQLEIESRMFDQTQLYGETQVLEERDGVGFEDQLIEDMGNWIQTQLVEDEEEREREGLEERNGEEREIKDLEGERVDLEERNGGEERERKDLEEREEEEREEEERENLIEGCEERESSVDSDASTDDETCGGSIHKRLTSLRVSSLRSGALAANSNFKSKSKSNTLINPIKCPSINQENVNNEAQKNNKTARQLFADVAPETDGTVPVLSYMESQEPSLLSQANALALVDKLISSDDMDLSQDINNNNTNTNTNTNINSGNKSSGSNKMVELVRKARPKSPAKKKKIFDWGDSEDEGGGEFFKKNKDLLIEKSRGGKVKSVPVKGRGRRKDEDLGLGRSDSRVVLSKRERICGEKNGKKLFDERENDGGVLVRENDGEVIVRENEGEVLERENEGEVLERENGGEVLERENDGEIGPDTQMALEAIQELVHGGPGPSKEKERNEETRGDRVSESKRKTRSSTAKIVQETTERSRTRSGKSILSKGETVKSCKKRKEVSKVTPLANSKKKEGNFGKSELQISRITRSCSRKINLLGQNVITPNNSDQIVKCKKKRTSYTISPSKNSEKKKRVYIRSATDLLENAKRQKRVYSSNIEELNNLNLPADKEKDKNDAKISTPSRVVNEKSPIFSPLKSERKSLCRYSVRRELLGLERTEKQIVKKWKDLRVRKDWNGVRVLLSNHLDDNIIKQQKKILVRLGVLEASNISEATHFIADKFTRTRNVLESIAMGKYIITPLWLQKCNLSNQHLDEKNFILKDLKKERELGFCMSYSIAIASEKPLLKGKRVVVTRNVKPSLEVVTNLVLASGGQPMERIGRSLIKEDKVPEDILVISCEEDYETCVPLLEKGGEIFSSELVLNGIIIQKLEFDRHRLFSDHVKKTRSTIWLRDKQAGKFLPVSKCT